MSRAIARAHEDRLQERRCLADSAFETPAGIPLAYIREAFDKEPDEEREFLRWKLSQWIQYNQLATGRRRPQDLLGLQTLLDDIRERWDLNEKDELLDGDGDIVRYEAEVKLTSSSGQRCPSKKELKTLIDGGANISLCSLTFAHMLEDIENITPIPLGVAVKGQARLYRSLGRSWNPQSLCAP